MIGVKESQSIARKPNSKAPHLAFPQSIARKPNSKAPHLAFLLGRGSEAHHATLLKL